MTDWFSNLLDMPQTEVFELSMNPRRRSRLRDDPDYVRVANRMEAERIAALPVIIDATTKAKMKRRAKNKAARKARRKS